MADAAPPGGLSGFRRFLLEMSDVPLRAALAATFIMHGWPKINGGIAGFSKGLFELGVPAATLTAWAVAMAEFAGGIMIALGFCTRAVALSHMAIMAFAISRVHYSQGFMMHSSTGKNAAGWEWQFALLCIATAMFIRGAGPLSLDHILKNYWASKRAAAATSKPA
jgi:putative oxidoreductase